MGRKLTDGVGRPCRLDVFVSQRLFDLTQADRDYHKMSAKVNRILEFVYADESGVDGIAVQVAEIDAEMQKLQAVRASLELQRKAAVDARRRETAIRSAEDVFRSRIEAAASMDGVDWKEWLYPKRKDIELFGYARAKQILAEELR